MANRAPTTSTNNQTGADSNEIQYEESTSTSPQPSDSVSATHPQRPKLPTKASKRIRGEIACAECRRLKIRCDRTIPCSTCVKRGCGALCPNGTIPPGEGSRFVQAATNHLHQKLARMEARLHSLEDALAIVNATSSDQPHPLLVPHEEEFSEDDSEHKRSSEGSSEPPSNITEAFGALHIEDSGISRFFGPSGGSESLLLKAKDMENTTLPAITRPPLQELDTSYLPSEINHLADLFPFGSCESQTPDLMPAIEKFLPSDERAIQLCDIFLEHLSWMFNIVTRRHIVDELIPAVYKQMPLPYGPHDLALLFIVLGIGCLVELSQPPYNLESQHYYRLARAVLALQPVLAQQSVVTIKVLHLMSVYNGMSGKESNLEQSYTLLDLAGQVALRIGFHIDPSMWGIEGKDAYDRRVYFWNLMAGVLWQSLVTGRPPGLLSSYIDCKIPSAEEENQYQQGEVPLGFGIWGFKASVECLIPLTKATLAVKPPTYDAILALDRTIRDFVRPASDNPLDERTAIQMRRFVRSHYQHIMLLFLHRGFFAQAMMENPSNPLQATHGRSVSAAYDSACHILQDTRVQFAKQPILCARIWRIWSLAFSAAIVVGTIAIRGLHMNFKPPALEEFQAACQIFEQAAQTSNRAARALPVLQTMLAKALQAAAQHSFQQEQPTPTDHTTEDELTIFAGISRHATPQHTDTTTVADVPFVPTISTQSLPPTPANLSTPFTAPFASPAINGVPFFKSAPATPYPRSLYHTPTSNLAFSAPHTPYLPPTIQAPDVFAPLPQHGNQTSFMPLSLPADEYNAVPVSFPTIASPAPPPPVASTQQPIVPPSIANIPHINFNSSPSIFDSNGVPSSFVTGLSNEWSGLFNEIPALASPEMGSALSMIGEGTMLDDRWASFMHNFDIVVDPGQQLTGQYGEA